MANSIITDDFEHCYLCHRYLGSGGEVHHVLNGADRKNSEKYGLTVKLCHFCHNEPPHGVHFDPIVRNALKREAQKIFEDKYSHEDFMRIFGRNYL